MSKQTDNNNKDAAFLLRLEAFQKLHGHEDGWSEKFIEEESKRVRTISLRQINEHALNLEALEEAALFAGNTASAASYRKQLIDWAHQHRDYTPTAAELAEADTD